MEGAEGKQLLAALRAVRRGDFSARLPLGWEGRSGEIAEAFNDIVELNQALAEELKRTSRVVGRDGRIGERASIADARGGWSGCVDSVNSLIGDLSRPTSEVTRVLGAVARGDLSQQMPLVI